MFNRTTNKEKNNILNNNRIQKKAVIKYIATLFIISTMLALLMLTTASCDSKNVPSESTAEASNFTDFTGEPSGENSESIWEEATAEETTDDVPTEETGEIPNEPESGYSKIY